MHNTYCGKFPWHGSEKTCVISWLEYFRGTCSGIFLRCSCTGTTWFLWAWRCFGWFGWITCAAAGCSLRGLLDWSSWTIGAPTNIKKTHMYIYDHICIYIGMESYLHCATMQKVKSLSITVKFHVKLNMTEYARPWLLWIPARPSTLAPWLWSWSGQPSFRPVIWKDCQFCTSQNARLLHRHWFEAVESRSMRWQECKLFKFTDHSINLPLHSPAKTSTVADHT